MYAPQPRRDYRPRRDRSTADQARRQTCAHPKFGSGVVTDYEGTGAHARVQVNFDEAGSKWLVLAYANLQPV